MNKTTFKCNCKGGKTKVFSETLVEHTHGFRPSDSYGSEGATIQYKRVQVNPALTGGEVKYNWFANSR